LKFPEKLILIGVDGAIPDFTKKMVEEGKLPNIAAIAEQGIFGSILSPYPTVTPNNWTSLVTGAWAGTTGITDYHVHHPGEPLNVIHLGFNTKECQAEYLWDAAERAGKKVLLMKYSASWPPTIKKGIQVDGCGPNWTDEVHEICGENLFTNIKGYPLSSFVEFRSLNDSQNLLVAPLEFKPHPQLARKIQAYYTTFSESTLDLSSIQSATLYAFLASEDGVYKHLIISRSENVEESVGKLREGEWSDWIKINFTTNEGSLEGMVRFKLIELSEDAERFRLYATHVMPVKGWTMPESLGPELLERFGGFVERPGWDGRTRGWIDDKTFLELVEYQNRWMAEASCYLMEKYNCDALFLQTHGPDYAHHLYLNSADPVTNPDEKSREYYYGILEEVYCSVDRLVGRISKVMDEKTLMVIVSDHGAQPFIADVNVWRILMDGGLLSMKKDEKGNMVIDWEKTKAVPQRNCYIYVNLKGRDPQGIVKPGEEYEEVREKIIELFMDYRDEKTGKKPFSLVLKREDAAILGLYGDRIGDIVYAVNPGFGHSHGQQLSTAKFGAFGSLSCLLVMAGPGVKRGAAIKPTRWLIDVAPTIAHLLGIPVPRDADGAIMYEILEDPDGRLKEKEALKREAENWKNAYEKMQGLIHIA